MRVGRCVASLTAQTREIEPKRTHLMMAPGWVSLAGMRLSTAEVGTAGGASAEKPACSFSTATASAAPSASSRTSATSLSVRSLARYAWAVQWSTKIK